MSLTPYTCIMAMIKRFKFSSFSFLYAAAGRTAVGVVIPLVLIIAAVTTTVAVSILVCRIKRVKTSTEKPCNIYADPLQGLETNEAYEGHNIIVTGSNVAYAINIDLKQNQVYTPSMVEMDNNPSSSYLDVEGDGAYASTTDLLDSAPSMEAYATVAELEPYDTCIVVTADTQGNGSGACAGNVTTISKGSEPYGSAIVTEKKETSQLESTSGAVDEYTDYHAYDSI